MALEKAVDMATHIEGQVPHPVHRQAKSGCMQNRVPSGRLTCEEPRGVLIGPLVTVHTQGFTQACRPALMDRNNVFLVVPLLGCHLSLKPSQPLASCFCFPTPEGVILEEHKDSMLQELFPAFSSAPVHPLSSPSGLPAFLILGPACTAGIYPCILRSCLGNL